MSAAEASVIPPTPPSRGPTYPFIPNTNQSSYLDSEAAYAPEHLWTKVAYGRAKPKLFTQDELRELFNLTALPAYEQVDLFCANAGQHNTLYLRTTNFNTPHSLGHFQYPVGCCGAGFIALISSIATDGYTRTLECLTAVFLGAYGRSFINAISARGQEDFEAALRRVGYEPLKTYPSLKTKRELTMWLAPREGLTFKYLPKTVIAKLGL